MDMRVRDPVVELKSEIQRLRDKRAKALGVDLEPASTYEVVTRQMVESLQEELREVRGRINGLLFLLVGMMIGEVLLRLIGGT
jgi:hypothetical protein